MILLVDDDPLQAYVTMSLLGREFGEVRRATDAAEALCLIEQADFAANLNLVVSGHHSTGIGGPAFVKELCTRIPTLPVLVLGMAGESEDGYKGDHVAFLRRPVAAQQMVSRAGILLSMNRRCVA